METSPKFQRQIELEEFVRQLREELDAVDDSEGDCWLDAIENRAVAVGEMPSALH